MYFPYQTSIYVQKVGKVGNTRPAGGLFFNTNIFNTKIF